jgi:two-component system sensor histidine kinase DegS
LGFGSLTIVRPLQRLARSAEQVTWEGYSAISGPPQGVQEVRDLHQAVIEMVERIRGNEAGMRDYLGAVTTGQETERARLGRELHDGPMQELIALSQRAEMADRLVERDQKSDAQAVLRELRQMSNATVGELRRLIGALSPAYLEDLGFVPALEMLIRQASARTQAEIHLDTGDNIVRLSSDVELAAYRIAQEALNNAVQHAQAQHIAVRVQCREDGLVLSVDDDGVGFALPRQPDLLTRSGRFGLISMRERASLLGGRLEVQSAPGQGTRVAVHLPECPIVT